MEETIMTNLGQLQILVDGGDRVTFTTGRDAKILFNGNMISFGVTSRRENNQWAVPPIDERYAYWCLNRYPGFWVDIEEDNSWLLWKTRREREESLGLQLVAVVEPYINHWIAAKGDSFFEYERVKAFEKDVQYWNRIRTETASDIIAIQREMLLDDAAHASILSEEQFYRVTWQCVRNYEKTVVVTAKALMESKNGRDTPLSMFGKLIHCGDVVVPDDGLLITIDKTAFLFVKTTEINPYSPANCN